MGSVLLFLWLLTLMHSIIAQPEMAQAAANDGVGGGFIGGVLERILWFGLGTPGLVIALAAWLLIALTMVLDVTVQSLFRWAGPIFARIERFLHRPIGTPPGTDTLARSDGYTPIQPIQARGHECQPRTLDVGRVAGRGVDGAERPQSNGCCRKFATSWMPATRPLSVRTSSNSGPI